MKFSRLALSAVLGSILTACAVSPTGRDQLLLYPESEMSQMGVASFSAIKEKDQQSISTNKAMNDYIGCIADAVLAQLPEGEKDGWEVVVFDSEQVNAFALPGKKIGVYTGLAKLAQNQDQLAAVIGHEIGHVLAHHSNERLSQQSLVSTSMAVTSVALGDDASTEDQAILMALGMGAQVGILLPYGRTHESEADEIGIYLMAKAGFDPRQSVKLWERMGQNSKSESWEILSTHPSNASRIRGLEANMMAAQQEYNVARNRGLTPQCVKPRS